MRKCFVNVGLASDFGLYPNTGFVKYTNHRRGTMIIKPLEETDTSVTLGEVVSELEVLSRHDELPEGDEHESEVEEESENEIDEIDEEAGVEA